MEGFSTPCHTSQKEMPVQFAFLTSLSHQALLASLLSDPGSGLQDAFTMAFHDPIDAIGTPIRFMSRSNTNQSCFSLFGGLMLCCCMSCQQRKYLLAVTDTAG